MFLVVVSCLVVFVSEFVVTFCGQVPLIIDTDIGQDFDDTFAVSFALSRQDLFDIKLILTATKVNKKNIQT